MPFVATVSSIVGPGGVVSSGDPSILVNGKPIGVVGLSMVTPHPTCPYNTAHCAATLWVGYPTVLANGKWVSGVGCAATCFDVVTTGAVGVQIGT